MLQRARARRQRIAARVERWVTEGLRRAAVEHPEHEAVQPPAASKAAQRGAWRDVLSHPTHHTKGVRALVLPNLNPAERMSALRLPPGQPYWRPLCPPASG